MREILKRTGLLLCVVLLTGCGMKKEVRIVGRTMGTTYHITVVTGYWSGLSNIDQKIAQRLDEINDSMSTYRPKSEISRFNAVRQTNEKFSVSEDFLHVMIIARDLFALTEGAWDGTVKPLVDLWGFSRPERQQSMPAADKIRAVVEEIGFDQITVWDDGYIGKQRKRLGLDLASIAKGYAVDQVAELIRSRGGSDFLVEIGGEVYASGLRKDGKPWKVGVNLPDENAAFDQVYRVVNLQNSALATSGDYRNFFEFNGRRYSHVLDPRTGYPVNNGVVSVSVIADTCTFADGLATALMVLGHEKGLALVERLDGVESLIIVRAQDNTLVDYYSAGFRDKR